MQISATQRFEIILCSEFNDPIESVDLLANCALKGVFVDFNEDEETRVEVDAHMVLIGERGLNCGDFRVSAPSVPGKYQLVISCSKKTEENEETNKVLAGAAFLDLVSDEVECVTHSVSGADKKVLLKTFRHVCGLRILEEYGSTLGSHLYDSAVVLLQYWEQHGLPILPVLPIPISAMSSSAISEGQGSSKASEGEGEGDIKGKVKGEVEEAGAQKGGDIGCVAVELGSGCGLVGLYLASESDKSDNESDKSDMYLSNGRGHMKVERVVLTDKPCQREILEQNILKANLSTSRVSFSPLDWDDTEVATVCASTYNNSNSNSNSNSSDSSNSFSYGNQNNQTSNGIRLVVGADVLYDKAAVGPFFRTAESLLRYVRMSMYE